MFNNTNIVRRELTLKEINHYSFDSFRIRIPINECKIYHSGLDKYIYHVSEEGEELDKIKQNSLKIDREGYAYYFRIDSIPNGNQGQKTKFLTVLVNSKMMKQDYFEGIHAQNIDIVYTKLIKLGVVNFTYESFIKAHVTDLDVKIDHKAEKDVFMETISELKEMAKVSVKNHIGCNWFKKKTNLGIEFNSRERATKSNPYFKIYHKETELKERSKLFFQSYLANIDFHNLVRLEYTLKDAKMMKSYGIKDTTLERLLELPQDELRRIHVIYLEKNFNKRIKQMNKDKENLSASDRVMMKMMRRILSKGTSFEVLKHDCLSEFGTDNKEKLKKSRMNKKLDELYHQLLDDGYEFEKSKKMGDLMGFIGAGNKGFFLDEIA